LSLPKNKLFAPAVRHRKICSVGIFRIELPWLFCFFFCQEKKKRRNVTLKNDTSQIASANLLNCTMDLPINTYCSYVANLDKNNVHKKYHDTEYGFPLHDDNELFARLVLEINQAGLSWTTILNKKENFFKAYDNFEIKKVAKYDMVEKT
jgi:hypothetical protein